MFLFITSLKHPSLMKNKERSYNLLALTLKSISSQRNRNFRIVVVTHEDPPPGFVMPSVDYIKVDMPPPQLDEAGRIPIGALRRDRGLKYAWGIHLSLTPDVTHVMFFDCDDFININLVDYCLMRDQQSWFVSQGYMYRLGSFSRRRLVRFNMMNGTSNIYSINDIPVDWSVLRGVNNISDYINVLGERFIDYFLGSHRFASEFLCEWDKPFSPLPFKGAVYVTGHGDNHSGISKVKRGWPVTPWFFRKFGVRFSDVRNILNKGI
jgi:hypothetical protein